VLGRGGDVTPSLLSGPRAGVHLVSVADGAESGVASRDNRPGAVNLSGIGNGLFVTERTQK
jgi:hypothetical protein